MIRTQVSVIPNNGKCGPMQNQCFWISLAQSITGQQEISPEDLRGLRRSAELDISTENVMFDSTNTKFREGAKKVALEYNLTIKVIPIDSQGMPLYGGDLIEIIGNGTTEVYISQFGTAHFQLIDHTLQRQEEDFVPLIYHDGRMKKINYRVVENKQENDIILNSLFSELERIHLQIVEKINRRNEMLQKIIYYEEKKTGINLINTSTIFTKDERELFSLEASEELRQEKPNDFSDREIKICDIERILNFTYNELQELDKNKSALEYEHLELFNTIQIFYDSNLYL